MKAVIALIALACALAPAAGQATTYQLSLTGSANVPPTNTGASAVLVIEFNTDLDAVLYNLTLNNVMMPLAAHIHVGAGPGQNGSVGVPLYQTNFASATNAGPVSGTVASNMVVPPTFTGPLEMLPTYNNTNVAMLLSEYIETGLAYAQVHTAAYPGGEIRANFVSSAMAPGVMVEPLMEPIPTA